MRTAKKITDRPLTAQLKQTYRCSVCRREMTRPQSILSKDGTSVCDACYRDRFFADPEPHRGQALDHSKA